MEHVGTSGQTFNPKICQMKLLKPGRRGHMISNIYINILYYDGIYIYIHTWYPPFPGTYLEQRSKIHRFWTFECPRCFPLFSPDPRCTPMVPPRSIMVISPIWAHKHNLSRTSKIELLRRLRWSILHRFFKQVLGYNLMTHYRNHI